MGFEDVEFLSLRDDFRTTFLNNCGRGVDLGTTTCLKPWNCG